MALHRLILRDFVLVQSLELDFNTGFTALTGETGAGKSILIDAIQLALGERARTDLIREGAHKTEVALEADATPEVQDWLAASGFDLQTEDPSRVLIKRMVDSAGKSRAWINGGVATVAQLREVGERLVEVFGQHAWTALMKEQGARTLFDSYAGVDLRPLSSAWNTLQTQRQKLHAAATESERRKNERLRLEWQIKEVDKLSPAAGEWESLNSEHGKLANSVALVDACTHALAALEGGDQDEELASPALKQIHSAIHYMDGQRHLEPEFESVNAALNEGVACIDSAARQLRSLLHQLQPDPDRLSELDERIGLWMGLAKRFKLPPESLYAEWCTWKNELIFLETLDDIDGLNRELQVAQDRFVAAAKTVSTQRHKSSKSFGAAVTALMQTLGMEGGHFEVCLRTLETPQSYGLESVSFLVAGHSGATPKPVEKVASGGELSRLALAVAVVSAELTGTPTLIFDEIDSGIGGATAQTVGQLMRKLGETRQVFSVTHLAQVAGCAHHHGVVRKTTTKKGQNLATSSHVHFVSSTEREHEIARMLGGDARVSEAVHQHAKELLSGVSLSLTAQGVKKRKT